MRVPKHLATRNNLLHICFRGAPLSNQRPERPQIVERLRALSSRAQLLVESGHCGGQSPLPDGRGSVSGRSYQAHVSAALNRTLRVERMREILPRRSAW